VYQLLELSCVGSLLLLMHWDEMVHKRVWGLRFLQRCFCRFRTSDMWCCVVWVVLVSWRHHIPLTCGEPLPIWHRATSQKTWIMSIQVCLFPLHSTLNVCLNCFYVANVMTLVQSVADCYRQCYLLELRLSLQWFGNLIYVTLGGFLGFE